MNRLQVGDECYVRAGGKIYKCQYMGKGFNHDHIAFPVSKALASCFFDITKGSNVKLVYPFPCVKELAV